MLLDDITLKNIVLFINCIGRFVDENKELLYRVLLTLLDNTVFRVKRPKKQG